jgi:putative chitinase
VTPQELAIATGARIDRATRYLPFIETAMVAYSINTQRRVTAFLANIGHESGGLRYTSELWGPTPTQERYQGRKDLGNLQIGDGPKFRGHGLMQVTGRKNHARMRDRLRKRFGIRVPDFEVVPEALALPEWAAYSAADFWDDHDLNTLADTNDFDAIADIINLGHRTVRVGDANGYKERLALYQAAQVIDIAPAGWGRETRT